MFSFWFKGLFRTLRFRLMLWNIGVVLLSVLLTLLVLRTSFRVTLLRETDQLLREDAIEIELAANAMHPDLKAIYAEVDRHTSSHRHRGMFVQLFDVNEKLIWSSLGVNDGKMPENPHKKANQFFTSNGFRLFDKDLDGNVSQSFHGFRVGSNLALVEADVESLSWLMLTCMGLLIILAPIGGYLLAVQATKPVSKIIDITSRLRPQNLSERFVIYGTGDELDRLASTINGFLDRIAMFIQKKKEFVANAAHELRSPLTAIGTASEIALSKERTPEEYQETLAEISEKCDHFRLLINQLLLLAETDSNTDDSRQVIQLDIVLEKAFEMFLETATLQQIDLKINSSQTVLIPAEARQIQQVVNNLIDNAIKFTPKGGMILLQLFLENGQAHLEVTDTGIGIGAADLPFVFDRFFQADKSHHKTQNESGGNGLGLSICKAIVESLSGTISVSSALGKGTTITVLLPLVSQVLGEHEL